MFNFKIPDMYFLVFIVLLIIILILLLIVFYLEIPRYYSSNHMIWNDLFRLDKSYSNKPRVNIEGKVVISLTTIPSRIHQIAPTLCSMLSQTRRVDMIRLNIPYKSLKGEKYNIPKILKVLKHIKIFRVEKDLGPSTKLLPTALDEHPNTKIIVIDDDMIYGSKLVETLVKAFKRKGGKYAITNYGSDSKIGRLYRLYSYIKGDRFVKKVFGCGGYIVTPSMLPDEIYDYSNAPEGAKYVDDDWIGGWLNINGVKIYLVGLKYGCGFFPNFGSIGTPSLCDSVNKHKIHETELDNWFRRYYV